MSDDNNIEELNCITKLNLPTDKVIKASLEAELDTVVIIGAKGDSDIYFASSTGKIETVLYLLEIAKKELLDNEQ